MPVGLTDTLNYVLDSCIDKYRLDRDSITGDTLPVRFRNTIVQLYEKTGHQVVVLVDEYDKPLLSTMITNPEQEEKTASYTRDFSPY